MTTLLKDLIHIPEQVQKGDFVLRLTEGVIRPEETLKPYVVTPELQSCFDNALTFIKSAIESTTSKATYLHGSFGSGKSHFMAVLHLILQGNTEARALTKLANTITKHNPWIQGKKFLLVPYHMIGATSMESGILGGYVQFIRRIHPDAPIPGVYLAEGLFQDAQKLRQKMGDPKFFTNLNENVSSSNGGWGEIADTWDQARFETALTAEPGSEERSQLISILIKQFFQSYDLQSSSKEEAFIPLDQGLSVITQHAQSLGYDALILFLDELVLWLASRATDLKFVHQEGQKLAKLVEAQSADRPIPLISFVARQRDLSELIGDSVPGADKLNFGDALKHWEGRFHRITLEDRNLPAIAEERILKCKTPSARDELTAAFDSKKFSETVLNVLLTQEGDRKMFRQVYPFSPALVQTLIAVSSVLQRERTALKVMMQLLVDKREVLTVGDVIPVGDLFDLVAHGDEAFSPEMANHFNNAKKLYHQKLLPLLEKDHSLRWEDIESLDHDDKQVTAFRNDDRLIKTLLLSALVPEVESLRALTADRLAALNHGTIKSPIPGKEGQEVLRRCKKWAAAVGELRVGEESTPIISVKLSGVDTDSIIQQAEREDTQGNRVRLLRSMIFSQVGIQGDDEFEQYYDYTWKQTKRNCLVLFKNIRELSPASLENSGDRWRIIIDYPFDEASYGPRDDISKLNNFLATNESGSKTCCWIPAFFSPEAQKDLGRLVTLEHILTGERFSQYATHLSPQDRATAKSILESQRSALRRRVEDHIDSAYGLESRNTLSIDSTHNLELHERFFSLKPGLELRPPNAANLQQGMEKLFEQALSYEFPGAPDFEADVTKQNNLDKVYGVTIEAARSSDGRVKVEAPLRNLVRGIANPLQLGELGNDGTHFLLGQHWKTHFHRKSAETNSITIKNLRTWINEPKVMGLPSAVENLIILTFAEQTHRSFYRHGIPVEVTLKDIPNDCELREQNLPDPEQWQKSVAVAQALFELKVAPLLNPTNVATFEMQVETYVANHITATSQYVQTLKTRLKELQLSDQSDRLKTAVLSLTILESLNGAKSGDIVTTIAQSTTENCESPIANCLKQAAKLHQAIENTSWEIFESIQKIQDDRQEEAQKIWQAVQKALTYDEHVVELQPELKKSQSQAVRLLAKTVIPPNPIPPNPVPPAPTPAHQAKSITSPPPRQTSQPSGAGTPVKPETGEAIDIRLKQAEDLLQKLAKELPSGHTIRLKISWIIEAEK
jgi:hypothetical protein